ncbi:MAG: hypothetical protein IK104_02615 [Clostridia bacterium]|nr:hypothetical protein [Clostridia bacterium]
MKCKSCGAEIPGTSVVCPYCNSEVEKEQPKIQITNNYYNEKNEPGAAISCPRCGHNNIKFRREEIGNTKSKTSKEVYYRTTAVCQSCGYSWDSNAKAKKSSNVDWKKIGLWILAISFFPIALSIWFYKTDKIKLNKKIRIAIIAGVWVLLLIIGATQSDQNADPSKANGETTSVSDEASSADDISETMDSSEEEASNEEETTGTEEESES